jgi:hypothetical protein
LRRYDVNLSRHTSMQTFWKVFSVILFATCLTSALVDISMFWWPDMPSTPKPTEGRIYPLNNHAHYTYMNRPEYLLDETIRWTFPVLGLVFAAIQYLVDPFGEIRKRRLDGSPPRGFR